MGEGRSIYTFIKKCICIELVTIALFRGKSLGVNQISTNRRSVLNYNTFHLWNISNLNLINLGPITNLQDVKKTVEYITTEMY